jgi:hypothetical protein
MLYPKYYDPLYFPECYPEIFATPSSVKLWLETSLCSHISLCCSCSSSSRHHFLRVKISVLWRDPYYLICSYVDGKLKQCILSLDSLQSKNYSHCQIVSRLCKAPPPVCPSASQILELYSVVAQEEPAWLFHSVELLRLHLSHLPAFILSFAANACSSDTRKVYRNRSSCISIIVDHFVLERDLFISAERDQMTAFSQDRLCKFVEHIKRLHGTSVAALLRENQFQLSPCLKRRPSISGSLHWFHESIDELVHRLCSGFSADALRGELKKIPAHR